MTENIKSAPLRHSYIELWISPTNKLERPVKLLVFAPLYTPTAIPKKSLLMLYTPTPEELIGMLFKTAEPTNWPNFAVLPYIKGITKPLTRILKEHDIQVTSRPVKTLQQHFPIPKSRPAEEDQCDVIYKKPCACCPWSYIGETKRSFTTRRKEHARNLKQYTKGSNVAKHAWTFNHVIDFNNSKIVDKTNNRSRKTLESWHTAKTVGADNNSCRLPRQYHILLKKH